VVGREMANHNSKEEPIIIGTPMKNNLWLIQILMVVIVKAST